MFIVSNPEKAPTFPLYLPRLCHFRYTWFHYIVISQAMQLQHFFGSKKRTPTKFAPPWSQVAGTQQPGLNPLPRPLEHESLQDASPWVEQTWLRTPALGMTPKSRSRQLIIIIIHPSSSSAFLCLSGLSTEASNGNRRCTVDFRQIIQFGASWDQNDPSLELQESLTASWSPNRTTRLSLVWSGQSFFSCFGIKVFTRNESPVTLSWTMRWFSSRPGYKFSCPVLGSVSGENMSIFKKQFWSI